MGTAVQKKTALNFRRLAGSHSFSLMFLIFQNAGQAAKAT
jgi:hypothetical protein